MTNTGIKIHALNMLAAQGATLTADQRAQLVAKADKFRAITGTTALTSINVPVCDAYTPSVVIGQLTYML